MKNNWTLEGIDFLFSKVHFFEKDDLSKDGGLDFFCNHCLNLFEVKRTLSNINYNSLKNQISSSCNRHKNFLINIGFLQIANKNTNAYFSYRKFMMKKDISEIIYAAICLEEKLIFNKTKYRVRLWHSKKIVDF